MMRRKLRQARRLTVGDWWLVARATTALLDGRLALRRMPVQAVMARLYARPPAPRSPVDQVRMARVAAAVDRAARNQLPPATCLPRALALCRLLRAEGAPAEVRIGVRREGGALLAHAWVESAGRVIGDRADVGSVYRPLAPESAVPAGVVVTAPDGMRAAGRDESGGGAGAFSHKCAMRRNSAPHREMKVVVARALFHRSRDDDRRHG